MAEALNLLIDQGSSYSINLEVKDANNSLVDLTGYSGTGHIRKQYTSNSATAFTVSVYSNGTLTAYLSANQTSSLVSDRYVYDIELTNTLLEVTRILEGIVTVTPQVTRFDNGDQVLTSNGITVYLAGGGNFTNGQSISVNNFTLTGTFTASSSNGSAGQVLTSNATSVYWSTLTTGTVTQVATGIGLTGGPITNTGTVSVLANTGIVANISGVFVNTAFIGTLTANNTSFVGNVSAASVVSNAQLTANVSALQSQITSNADTTYTNAVAYVTAQSFVNTSQLSANVSTLHLEITSNAAAAYTNAVAYVDSRPFVNTSQLSSNLALYAQLSGAAFTGSVTANNLTVTGNLTLQGNTVIVAATDLVVNDAVISLHSPANGSALTVNDGRNIGISFHYYDTEDRHGALLRDNSTGRLTWYSDSTDPNIGNNVTGTILGTIQSNTFYAGNSTVFATVNATSYTGTSNNSTNFDGLSLATVQGQITSNAAAAYTNAVAYVTEQSFATTSQLSANVTTLQSQITSNAAAAYANAVLYVDGKSFVNTAQLNDNVVTLQGQITSNAAAAYTNAVAYVDSRSFVNTSQLSSNLTNYVTTTNLTNNLALYATIANPTFTGDVTTGNVIINTTGGIRANGSFGTNGQVLTSNGTTVYWSTGASFTNGQSISVNNFTLTGAFTANSSNGSNGQVLISNGAGAYWGPAPLAETFEYYSRNLKSVNSTIVYANTGFASNVVYSDGTVKSLFYDVNNFVIRVNITANGFVGNKYISYSNNAVSAITYGT